MSDAPRDVGVPPIEPQLESEPTLRVIHPDDAPEELAPGDLRNGLAQLAGLLMEEETLESTLARIARMTASVLPACDEGTLSVVEEGRVTVRASTGEVAQTIDDRQFAVGVGPCLDSMRDRRPIMVDCVAAEDRWSEFMTLARENGVTSTLSMPLEVNDRVVGILNLYSLGGTFGPDDDVLGRSFAREAAVAVANARAMAESRRLVSNLESALESRDLIGRAIGILMVKLSCDSDRAFAALRKMSQRENVKVRDIAQRMVDSVENGG